MHREKVMRRKAETAPDRVIDDLKTVDGIIAPHTGSRSKLYGFEATGTLPKFHADWKGLSGAGVFCEGFLPTEVPPSFGRC
ncbi:hypothetical protein ACFC09_39580 [Streptomyces sp. NPDC056161]|uniref:hypothetical protein n=1 Tax=Streptomyces sp. NPDC056161 TaxID=3345732 RepID=UPI0035D95CAB